MSSASSSLEDIIGESSRSLVIGIGGGGDVAGALATARFLEFCGLEFVLGGLSWERRVFDPLPGPRMLSEVNNVRVLHQYAWMANRETQTNAAVYFAESRMAAFLGKEILLVDISGGVQGVVAGLERAIEELQTDLLVGIDVGGDSLARGTEPGLRSPLADSVMLAAFVNLEKRGYRVLWGVFGYGSDGELTGDEIEAALTRVAGAGGLLGAWSLTPKTAAELQAAIKTVPTEASAIPVQGFRGFSGAREIRDGDRRVKITPLTALTFFISAITLFDALSCPAQAVYGSSSLDQANDALHAIGIKTELDAEREYYQAQKP